MLLSYEDLEPTRSRLVAKGLGPQDVILKCVKYAKIPEMITPCSAGMFFLRTGRCSIGTSPTKFGEFLAAGLPVVVNGGIGDLSGLVEREGVGVVVRDLSPQGYEEAALAISEMIGVEEVARRCRAVARKVYSMERGIERYWEIYRSLSSWRRRHEG